jgi:hypothetical protein
MRVIFGNNIERVVLNEGKLKIQYRIDDDDVWHDSYPILGLTRRTILFLIDCVESLGKKVRKLEKDLNA